MSHTGPHQPPQTDLNRNGCKSSYTGYKIKKVVLDAGHGGKDPGCSGASSKEKHNTLAIVLRLGEYFKLNCPDVQVIYTRDDDTFVNLNERAAIANRNNADLFISVHCNSISVSSVQGTETYVMGLHRAQENLEVAKRENASIFMEENYEVNYGGYDPNSAEAHILGSMWQSAYLEQSILFAGLVQEHTHSIAQRNNKGVKQAGFLVLRETAMPSVLIETGYMTNRQEENFLISPEGRDLMAEAIFTAFRVYRARMEGGRTAVQALAQSPVLKPKMPVVLPAPRREPPVETSVNAQPVSLPTQPRPKPATSGYRILLTSASNRISTDSGPFALVSGVLEEKRDGTYFYFLGEFTQRSEAERLLSELQNIGFRKATIVALP